MSGGVENSSCLHLVARSSGDALERCLALCSEHDELLFIDDAVMFLVSGLENTLPGELAAPLFLRADLEARGLAGIAAETGARTATDAEFAALLRKHGRCLTWK